ncbi:hypothetical protein B0H17DRAFT_1079510 [Mycena rosella]|uniref:4a-hydroxytetrahydrobiopterin dehydratase n=1 Tax=Mycena rosella TaxID=1033263 RepID=A0AAD7D476_MYCRO|nr:hypothetical protein B0H17DRAFT_1079510 [Mycena rosella]
MFTLRLSRRCVQRHVSGRRLLSDVSLPIPAKPKGWPTPWITEDDATNFLFPLYAHGWYIAPVRSDAVQIAALLCRFDFPSFKPAAAFTKDIFDLIETERHHPRWLNISHSTTGSTLKICSTTDSALRPQWDAADTTDNRALAGLTLRDLRFAALVSSLHTSPGPPDHEFNPSSSRPPWAELCTTLRSWSTPQEAPKKGSNPRFTCAACAGPHQTSDCAVRHSLTPPRCTVCKGLHWRVDCPILKTAQRTGLTISQVKRPVRDGSFEPPPAPCPNCGGDHWKVDCRVPQAPPNLLERLALPIPNPEPINLETVELDRILAKKDGNETA